MIGGMGARLHSRIGYIKNKMKGGNGKNISNGKIKKLKWNPESDPLHNKKWKKGIAKVRAPSNNTTFPSRTKRIQIQGCDALKHKPERNLAMGWIRP